MIVTPIRALRDNYVWMLQRPGGDVVTLVDPGEAAPVEAVLAAAGKRVAAILVTHHHHDHVGGIEQIARRHRARVIGPAMENIPARSFAVNDGDAFTIDELELELTAMHVPGHTLGAISYYGEGTAFTGDTLFTAGCGRLFEGTADQMFSSLERLKKLRRSTQIYCGHEYTLANLRFAAAVEPDNADIAMRLLQVEENERDGQPSVPAPLELELRTNPFLRTDQASVQRAAESQSGHALNGPAAVFAVLREWKNHF
ncbi:MAG: hydroxyacylglutathione hydrolase [Gammaproteobacteria bacterium]